MGHSMAGQRPIGSLARGKLWGEECGHMGGVCPAKERWKRVKNVGNEIV